MYLRLSPKRIAIILSIFAPVVLVMAFLFYGIKECNYIYDYDPAKDKAGILELFAHDRYWLTSAKQDSIEFQLKYKTPDTQLRYRGKMQVKVIREDDQFVGFTAYFMEEPTVGKILFLGVKREFRSRGYGKKLMECAIRELQKMGAESITLVTRTSNIPAQKVYEKLGFKETHRDENGYMYYVYIPQ